MSGRPARSSRTRGAGHDTVVLTVGTVVSLVAAYGYVVVGTHSLGARRFAPISVMWTFWALTAAAVTFPVQHWATRTLYLDGSDGRVRAALPRLAATAAGASLLTGLIAWLFRDPLFHRADVSFPLLTALIPFGSVAVGVVRGTLAGRRRFREAAVSIAGENVIRLFGAVVVAAAGGGEVAFGSMLVAGFLVIGLSPQSLVLRGEPVEGSEAEPRSPLRFLAGVSGGSLIAQVVLSGAPVALAVSGGTAEEVTAVFVVLSLFRVPHNLALSVGMRLTGALTNYVKAGREDHLGRLRRWTVVGTTAGAIGAAALGASVMPPIVGIVFGDPPEVADSVVALLAAGSVVALGGLVYMLVLLARGQARQIATAQAAALAVAVLVAVATPAGPALRIGWAFLVAEVSALVLMLRMDAQ